MNLQVTVQINGEDVPVGQLYANVRRGIEITSFTYDAKYLNRPDAFALAPDMPLIPGALHSSDLPMFRAFGDCIPDRWGRS